MLREKNPIVTMMKMKSGMVVVVASGQILPRGAPPGS